MTSAGGIATGHHQRFAAGPLPARLTKFHDTVRKSRDQDAAPSTRGFDRLLQDESSAVTKQKRTRRNSRRWRSRSGRTVLKTCQNVDHHRDKHGGTENDKIAKTMTGGLRR